MGQLLQYKLAPERQSPKQDDMEYLCTTFIDHVRNLFDANGLGGEDDRGAISGGVFLVGYKAHLYEVHYEYQIFRSADGYAAIGSGQDFALGSLASTAYLLDPEKRVAVALRAAARHCVSVVSPYDTVVVNGV
jgi:ATP-dependent protease HslVU (ClpYQ) peptidase subunit